VQDSDDTAEAFPTEPPAPPTISCSRCDRSWDLAAELDRVGNQAFEQFALDHHRHTGHFPDDVHPWQAVCQRCPDAERRLRETPARRWAETHARHTRHTVLLRDPDGDTVAEIQSE
jgi:hypothetical protein